MFFVVIINIMIKITKTLAIGFFSSLLMTPGLTADLSPARQAEVDEMVGNLLQWIQGFYQQKNRKGSI